MCIIFFCCVSLSDIILAASRKNSADISCRSKIFANFVANICMNIYKRTNHIHTYATFQ